MRGEAGETPTLPMNQPSTSSEFQRAAREREHGIIREFLLFLRHNKKWWLLPIIIVLLLLGLIIVLGGTALAPFIYTLF